MIEGDMWLLRKRMAAIIEKTRALAEDPTSPHREEAAKTLVQMTSEMEAMDRRLLRALPITDVASG